MTDKIPLMPPVYETSAQRREVEPAVWGTTCAGCGELFSMRSWCNDNRPSELLGTFNEGAVDPESGRFLGNMFSAHVCSFGCADKVMKGGWRDIERYQPFAKADRHLVRCELTVTALVAKGRREILEAEKDLRHDASGGSFYRLWPSGQKRSVVDLAKHLVEHEKALAEIAAKSERTGLPGAIAGDVLWAESLLQAALDVSKSGVRPSNGGSVTIGLAASKTPVAWTPGEVLGRIVDAAGVIAKHFPEAVGVGRLSSSGWRLTREGLGEKTILLVDMLDVLKNAEDLERDDENFEEVEVADRAHDGADLARQIIAVAEWKLDYKRVLDPEDDEAPDSEAEPHAMDGTDDSDNGDEV